MLFLAFFSSDFTASPPILSSLSGIENKGLFLTRGSFFTLSRLLANASAALGESKDARGLGSKVVGVRVGVGGRGVESGGGNERLGGRAVLVPDVVCGGRGHEVSRASVRSNVHG